MWQRVSIGWALAVLLWLAPVALAQSFGFEQINLAAVMAGDEQQDKLGQLPELRPADPFAKGVWTFQVYGLAVLGEYHQGEIYSGHIGFGYHLADNFSVNLEGLGAKADAQFDDDGVAGGLDLTFRWHLYRIEGFSIYLEGGAGFQQATTEFPSDSHFTFRPQLGMGATLRLDEKTFLMGGVRWLHISNAGTSDINDGWDGEPVYLGLMFLF